MANYEIVAFYSNSEAELETHAAKMGALFGFDVRYEKIPGSELAVTALLTEQSVVTMFSRDVLKWRKLLKYVYAINRPVILVGKDDDPEAFNHLHVPVGYLTENKEKAVWANFFQHCNRQADIKLVVPSEKDDNIAQMVADNLFFIEQVLEKSAVKFTKTFTKGSFEQNLKSIFQTSTQSVVLVLLPFRLFSFYIPSNLRVVKKYSHTPTMLISRDDKLYIPCH